MLDISDEEAKYLESLLRDLISQVPSVSDGDYIFSTNPDWQAEPGPPEKLTSERIKKVLADIEAADIRAKELTDSECKEIFGVIPNFWTRRLFEDEDF